MVVTFSKKVFGILIVSLIINFLFGYLLFNLNESYKNASKGRLKYNQAYYEIKEEFDKSQNDICELLNKTKKKEEINLELYDYKYSERHRLSLKIQDNINYR